MNNLIERYNRHFKNLFDSPNPGLFVFCERVREEAEHWKTRYEHALKGHFASRLGGKKCLGQRCDRILKSGSQRRRRALRGCRSDQREKVCLVGVEIVIYEC